MSVIVSAATAFALVVLGATSPWAAEVTEGEYFQISPDGEMVRIYGCVTEPYPKCDFRFEHPDGSVGPVIDAWNEDLAEMRDNFSGGTGDVPAPSPEPLSDDAPMFPLADAQTCEATEFAGIQPGSVPASEDLMRQLIRDYFTGVATPGYDVSVTINSLQFGEPFINTMSVVEGQGATLITNGAPENAAIYPMRVQLSVCEEESQYNAQVRTHDWELYCFVNDVDQWACGVSQSY